MELTIPDVVSGSRLYEFTLLKNISVTIITQTSSVCLIEKEILLNYTIIVQFLTPVTTISTTMTQYGSPKDLEM